MSYYNFGTDDFIQDPYFIAWVLQDDPEINSFWELWIELYPEKKETVSAAINIILNKSIEKTEPITERQVKKAWQQLNKSIEPGISPLQEAPALVAPKNKTRQWMQMAASIAGFLILTFCVWFYLNKNSTITYNSLSSQVIPVSLPDGSEVMLNANSSLSFKKNWSNNTKREVWLKGEAFFSVTKKPIKGLPTFVVHARNINVQVLGTKFNVADRGLKTTVVLNAGKIKLSVASTNTAKTLTMEPGDYVAVVQKNNKITKTRVNPAAFSGWRSHKLIFNDTPLSEVMGQIEQTYGTKIILPDSSVLNRTFTGTFPNNDLPLLLNALERAFELQVNRHGKQLIIAKNK